MKQNKFSTFKFKTYIEEAINNLGFYEPTEIQQKMIPTILRGESAVGQSQTGTGKTHAYLLPILEMVDPELQEVQAVITAPTRELANQIYQEIIKITKYQTDQTIMSKCFIGGTDKQRTIEKLKKQPQIVVGTPGRIHDLMKEQALFLHTSRILVVDEADIMLDMGFLYEVDQIAGKMPQNLQMLVFSATIPEKLKPFLKKYMENPKYEHVQPTHISAQNIEHNLVPLRSREKIDLLFDMLISYNPYLAIVFTNTKSMADEVADNLLEKGLKVGRIHGDLSPRERTKMMKQIRNLEFQYIVATDLAARGIDIEGVSHVINYELPQDLDFYIHRAGRTARAGYSGIATTIYQPSDEDALNRLEKMGIVFSYKDLQKGEWVSIAERNKRKNRKKQVDEIEEKARNMMKKPRKVKPGYKKKINQQVEKMKKRERKLQKRK
ncbi:DEAD/DEAH box helicase [Heyndrickxia oleronia]|uniref:DEAD-box ATP-dependent RNA helicase CshB n=1 Tax=Heyndrickxia oleronia TaxID=38875 RepID=A0A8E2I7I1_9BACI|nr:DEAD/DEAH box helicase [Heyndrickxia oleronia]OJH18864.1 DEAD/DEAH box helicase [Bacillus obstructivus]MBU5213438.1 DEAD/DEAH box helicase [Heyndrickxia oleronia]MCI1593472.1 DEAD/DEAH box helicase [Heyndrickxia oleronia]MCI1614767.1 DEAD/DEAH box helicase [Heyndrickxia oleronia]MCI1745642.1 DEAD/DEAH box helicase [Heyndrickxia oleronia]